MPRKCLPAGSSDYLLVNLHKTVERLLRRQMPKLRDAAQLADVSLLSQTQRVHEESRFR